jgi:cytochrome oxidase Cu insertion factor (SCO1/SenC/PrrC family)
VRRKVNSIADPRVQPRRQAQLVTVDVDPVADAPARLRKLANLIFGTPAAAARPGPASGGAAGGEACGGEDETP